jgi:nitrogen-specific signal transduction histidine kinase
MRRKPLVETIQNFAQNIVDTVREPLLMLDTTLRVQSANRAFYQTFHVSREETENHLIYELGNGQWDIPKLRALLEEILPRNASLEDFDVEHNFPVLGLRRMKLDARRIALKGDKQQLILLSIRDETGGERI